MKSIDYEKAVIGSLLINSSLIDEVELTVEDFETESYRLIFQTILDAIASNQVSDALTISSRLSKSNPGDNWMLFIGKTVKDCVSSANIGTYAKLLKNESSNRKAKEICADVLNDIDKTEDSEAVIDNAVAMLMALSNTRRSYEHSISQALSKALEMVDNAMSTDGTVGIQTGIEKLDNVLGGFHKSDLYAIGARPSMGKTSVLLNLANNHNEQCGIISSEQPAEQIASRLISINGRVNSSRMRNGTLEEFDWTKITNSIHHLHENNNIWINDKSGINILEVVRQARKWKQQHDIKVLYVDYIQRIKWTDLKVAKWEQVGNVVMSLKELARDLDIPVVALAQVNREVEKRSDARPGMGDLANSSEIEKEADVIITLYRDEVYFPDSSQKGIMEINVCKNRHGPTGITKVAWSDKYMRIDDLDIHHYQDSYASK